MKIWFVNLQNSLFWFLSGSKSKAVMGTRGNTELRIHLKNKIRSCQPVNFMWQKPPGS